MELIPIILYSVAFAAIVYYMIQLKPVLSPMEKAVATDTEYRTDMPTALSWPWSITSYSFWPSWLKPDGSPVLEDYHYVEYKGNKHGGGYGYTGRQNAQKQKTFEGDHYGWDMDGGMYGPCGYGYTGREKYKN